MIERLLISGASRGIGRALAERWCERGAHVVGCSRGSSDLDHPRYTHVEADVSVERDVTRLVRESRKRLGGLDGCVCNAGAASMNHLMLTPDAVITKLLDVNVRGTILLAREAAKVMSKARSGSIVTFSSVAVALRLEGEAVYAASKAAVEAFTRVAARELGPLGITVNCVAPPPVDTDLIRGVPSAKIDALVDRLALKRKGTMGDVDDAVRFFLETAGVTGQVLYLGGAG